MAKSTKTATKKKSSRSTVAKKSSTKSAAKKTTKKTVSTKAKASNKKTVSKKVTKKSTKKVAGLISLKKLHVFFALVMATLAGLLVAYGNDVVVGVTSSYLVENTLTNSGELLPAMRELFQVNLLFVSVGVLLAGFLWHLLLATKLYATYSSQVTTKFTSLNWIEHAAFGPWIIGIIAATVGIRDAMTLLLIASIPALTALLGYLTDRYNLVGKKTLLKTKVASETLILPWVVIGVSILHTYLYGFIALKASIYALLAAAFIIYVGLGFVHKRQILKQGKFADFVLAEQVVVSMQAALLVILAVVFFV